MSEVTEELAYLKSRYPEAFTESEHWSDTSTESEKSESSSVEFHKKFRLIPFTGVDEIDDVIEITRQELSHLPAACIEKLSDEAYDNFPKKPRLCKNSRHTLNGMIAGAILGRRSVKAPLIYFSRTPVYPDWHVVYAKGALIPDRKRAVEKIRYLKTRYGFDKPSI